MLDANENYFVSTYLTNFNHRHLMSKIKINKSAIADVGDFPYSYPQVLVTNYLYSPIPLSIYYIIVKVYNNLSVPLLDNERTNKKNASI